jgi:RNA polymerase sigma-70 factor (ECF subfamily)
VDPGPLSEIEEQIRTRLHAGQRLQAFELLMSHFQNKVFRLAYSMLGNRALAEETAQDIFVRIWKALDGYRGQSSLSTWIYTIARNTCLSALSAAGRKPTVSIEDPVQHKMAETRAATARHVDSGLDLDLLLSQLGENHRRVVMLFYLEDKSYEEVSSLLGLPMGTVKTYLHRARKQLATAVLESRMGKERI